MSNETKAKLRNLLFTEKKDRIIVMALIAFFLPAIYLLVYFMEGNRFVYSHTMYIPIVLASMFFGIQGGVVVGVTGGLLLGPLMPIDILLGEPQMISNWIYRLLFFVIVGIISGYFSSQFKKSTKQIIDLLTHDSESNLPTLSSLDPKHKSRLSFQLDETDYVVSVRILNHNNIVDLLGQTRYYNVLKQIEMRLNSQIKCTMKLFQADSNRLLIIIKDFVITPCLEEISLVFHNPFMIDEIPVYLKTAIGTSIDRASFQIKMEQANVAARYAEINHLAFATYHTEHQPNMKDLEILGSFPKALETNQTRLVFQPKICLKTKDSNSAEALIRWDHETLGAIAPMDFIPMIEETQLINPLTEWVLLKGIEQVKLFQDAGLNIAISINISTKNLYNASFVQKMIGIIRDSQVSPSLIEFEITESALMENPEKSTELLQLLKEFQIKLSIDDFGTGYSSLSYLSRFPIHIVKIDRFFVKEMANNPGVCSIVDATIQLAHKLGLETVAEGVENEETADLLTNLNCDYAQGYYFARPLEKKQIMEWYCNQPLVTH
jgi:EAL domain-containing protein (putative c-di-GMP-specific phosphodiesterase class I)/GGDEF domain-containing protein